MEFFLQETWLELNKGNPSNFCYPLVKRKGLNSLKCITGEHLVDKMFFKILLNGTVFIFKQNYI